jgi:ATP-dependent DNA ligase
MAKKQAICPELKILRHVTFMTRSKAPIWQRAAVLRKRYNRTFDVEGSIVFHHACKLGCEGIVSKRLGSPYRSGRSADWIKVKNPKTPAVKREAEDDWC